MLEEEMGNMRKNPVVKGEVQKALELLDHGTLLDVANKLDRTFPKSSRRHWEEEEIKFYFSGEKWVTEDADNPGIYHYTPDNASRDYYSTKGHERWHE
jgi:hypothetical protein